MSRCVVQVHQRAGMDELSVQDFIDIFTEVSCRSQPGVHPLDAVQSMLDEHQEHEEEEE